MNLKFLRAFWNPAFVVGLAILALGCGPLVVFGVLQAFGYFPENNGLGLGLLFWIAVWPALALSYWRNRCRREARRLADRQRWRCLRLAYFSGA